MVDEKIRDTARHRTVIDLRLWRESAQKRLLGTACSVDLRGEQETVVLREERSSALRKASRRARRYHLVSHR